MKFSFLLRVKLKTRLLCTLCLSRATKRLGLIFSNLFRVLIRRFAAKELTVALLLSLLFLLLFFLNFSGIDGGNLCKLLHLVAAAAFLMEVESLFALETAGCRLTSLNTSL